MQGAVWPSGCRCAALWGEAGADLLGVGGTQMVDKGLAVTLLHTNVEAVGDNLSCPPAVK